jgi:hypothetical protein
VSQEKVNGGANAQASAASSVAPKERAQLYTHNAEEGLNAAELINSAVKKRVVGSVVPRRVEVAPPSGPSTSGGRKARQSITLIQTSQQAASVMIGFLDVAQKTAGVREYELVAKQYEARFRSAFETTKEEYQELTKDLTGMLLTLGYKLVPDEPRDDGRSSMPAPEPVPSSRKPFAIAAGLVVFALLGLLLTRC